MNETIDQKEYIENRYASEIQRAEQLIEKDANKKATRILNKNKREIIRLKQHAGECLINNNKLGYCYAIKKLRKFYKQPYTNDLIDILWKTSRENILNIK